MCFIYAEDYEFSEEQKEDLWFHINQMDSEYIVWWQKRQPKPKAPKGARGRGAKP